ncbi:YjzC family protein [Paenibacillus chartarius]|uniref:YjzC family protein n=1 Tax=Paenibacillus chartarius TaxID=747481 RepID=A0ABV6DE72_9BACL
MGEQTQFNRGQKAPNDGIYKEVGDRDHHMGIEDPQIIHLKKGERFPNNTNEDRKWVRVVH